MKKNQVFYTALTFLCLLGLLAACATAATPTAAPATAAPATAAPATAAPATAALATAVPPTAVPTPAPVTLTFLCWNDATDTALCKALTTAYTALHPNVTFTIDEYPGGADGDNLVKTKLATGEMDDIFFYNSGALLVALNPAQTLVDLSAQPFMANLDNAYKQSVSVGSAIYGVPNGVAAAGGILYNKKVFASVGISVPKTWADFESNNDKIKAAGIAPVIQTYGDTWTSQLFVLGDEYNVQAAEPTYPADYTANKVKIASDPVAMAGFSYLAEGFKKGWYEKDFQTMKNTQGLQLLADGKGAQYPMLTQVFPTIVTQTPNEANDIGFFGLPGTDASKNGATIWMPNSLYIAKTSKNIAAAEDFLAFVATPAGADALTAAVPPTGPYMIKGATLPSNVAPIVNDLAAYINSGNDAPALEFVSPLKGPSLEQICIAVGTGQMTAAAGAAAYDQDVAKQAKQLGLPGW